MGVLCLLEGALGHLSAIFEYSVYLEIFFIMTRVPLWHVLVRAFTPDFSVISWNLFKIFFTEEGSLSVAKGCHLIWLVI